MRLPLHRVNRAQTYRDYPLANLIVIATRLSWSCSTAMKLWRDVLKKGGRRAAEDVATLVVGERLEDGKPTWRPGLRRVQIGTADTASQDAPESTTRSRRTRVGMPPQGTGCPARLAARRLQTLEREQFRDDPREPLHLIL